MSQRVTAELNYIRMSPRKLRLVANMMRGRGVSRTAEVLSVLPKKAARHLGKLLQSAAANAKHTYKIEADQLRIAAITVDGGPVLKRWMPRAHGRASPIRERTSHVKLALEEIIQKQKSIK